MENSARQIKLALCIPNENFFWMADFGYSLAQMCVYIASTVFEEGQNREVLLIDRRSSAGLHARAFHRHRSDVSARYGAPAARLEKADRCVQHPAENDSVLSDG